jgi:hypothetical protein
VLLLAVFIILYVLLKEKDYLVASNDPLAEEYKAQ